jgi:hypothetical protein
MLASYIPPPPRSLELLQSVEGGGRDEDILQTAFREVER